MHQEIGTDLIEIGPQERVAPEGKALKDIVSGIGAPQKTPVQSSDLLEGRPSHIALPVYRSVGLISSVGTRRFTPQKSRGGSLELPHGF